MLLLILARLDGKLQNLEPKSFDLADLAMEAVGTLVSFRLVSAKGDTDQKVRRAD